MCNKCIKNIAIDEDGNLRIKGTIVDFLPDKYSFIETKKMFEVLYPKKIDDIYSDCEDFDDFIKGLKDEYIKMRSEIFSKICDNFKEGKLTKEEFMMIIMKDDPSRYFNKNL
jgi:hypothetical protein